MLKDNNTNHYFSNNNNLIINKWRILQIILKKNVSNNWSILIWNMNMMYDAGVDKQFFDKTILYVDILKEKED